MSCDNWLGLSQYNCSESVSKNDGLTNNMNKYEPQQEGIKKHLTKHTEKGWEIRWKVNRNPWGQLVFFTQPSSQMCTALSQPMALAKWELSNDVNSKILKKNPRILEDLWVLSLINIGYKSKRRPSMLSLSTTANMGSIGLTSAQAWSSTFVLSALANHFRYKIIPNIAGTGVVHLSTNYVGNIWNVAT